eukprot:7187904-Prymnesium_polylepis.3
MRRAYGACARHAGPVRLNVQSERKRAAQRAHSVLVAFAVGSPRVAVESLVDRRVREFLFSVLEPLPTRVLARRPHEARVLRGSTRHAGGVERAGHRLRIGATSARRRPRPVWNPTVTHRHALSVGRPRVTLLGGVAVGRVWVLLLVGDRAADREEQKDERAHNGGPRRRRCCSSARCCSPRDPYSTKREATRVDAACSYWMRIHWRLLTNEGRRSTRRHAIGDGAPALPPPLCKVHIAIRRRAAPAWSAPA